MAKPVRNSPSNAGKTCPLKEANAFKTRMDGISGILRELSGILRELKWSIFAMVILFCVITAAILGVDLTPIAEAVISTTGVMDIGNLLLRQ
jgi:hypothetical protein